MTLKDDMKPIYDMVHRARIEASNFYNLSHVDDEEPVSAAHKAFESLADAIAALTRLIEAHNTPPHQPDVVEDGDEEDEDAGYDAGYDDGYADGYADAHEGMGGYMLTDRAALQKADDDAEEDDAEEDDDPLAADRRDPAWAWAETELTAIAYALLDNADQPQQPDDEPEQPDDEPEQPDDEPEQPDDDAAEEPLHITYIRQELAKLTTVAQEWLNGYENLRRPDESDERDVLACLEEHQAMIGRSHYLAMELLKLRLEASEDDQGKKGKRS